MIRMKIELKRQHMSMAARSDLESAIFAQCIQFKFSQFLLSFLPSKFVLIILYQIFACSLSFVALCCILLLQTMIVIIVIICTAQSCMNRKYGSISLANSRRKVLLVLCVREESRPGRNRSSAHSHSTHVRS